MAGQQSKTYVVGVDIGLTGTAVAHAEYSITEWNKRRVPDQSEINRMARVIQIWPMVTPGVLENKVPTLLEAKPDDIQRKWGFECTYEYSPHRNPDDDAHVKRYFKLFLEDGFLQQGSNPDYEPRISLEEVREWYKSFLQNLYSWIGRCLENSYREGGMRFHNDRIEYIFSVPTTWPTQTVDLFKGIIKDAGFGSIPSHRVSIGLTEAEATAVYSLKHSNEVFSKYDQIIVCDAGGGTTDVTTLELVSDDRGVFGMKQLCIVEGDVIGSVQIDEEVKDLIDKRLKMARVRSGQRKPERDPRALEAFQSIKHVIGKDEIETLPYLMLDRVVKGEPKADYLEARVFCGKMEVDLSEIHEIFDSKVRGIARLIDAQMARTHDAQTGNKNQMPFLILSGGLGSSEYVYGQLKELYRNRLKIVRAKEPQLAVCKGLVLDRLYRHICNVSMIRCCRASYGIVFRELFDKRRHPNQKPVLDPVSKRYFVDRQINWLISKDAPIGGVDQPDLVHKSFRNLGPKDNEARWEEVVVAYTGPLSTRPQVFDETLKGSTTVVKCHITPGRADEHNGAMVKKRKRLPWLKLVKVGEYWKLNYGIKLTVNPADLGFELWYNKEKRMQQGIDTDWETVYVGNDDDS